MRLSPQDRQPPPAPAAASVPEPPGPLAPRRRARRGAGIGGLVSTVIHAVVVALILLELDPRGRPPEELPPPSFAVVFQGGSDQAPRGAEAPVEAPVPVIVAPPPAPPQAEAPPAPPAPPVPATPPAPPPAPAPPRLAEAPPLPAPPTPPPSELAPPPTPAPPMPAPAPSPPQVATAPVPPPEPPPGRPSPAPPPPHSPPPAISALPLPPPAPPGAPAPPPAPPRVAPLDLTNRPPVRLGEAQPAAPRRGLDLRPGATLPGPGDDQNLRVRGAQAGPDWRNAFRQWLEQNLRYPREAAELGEQGPVTVRIVTGADGRVRGVELRTPSRSIFLNYYSQAVFRGRTLPPFPPGTAEEQVTIDLTINYILYGRR